MGAIVRPVTIASGQSDSTFVYIENFKLVGFYMPAAWDVAQITIRASITETGIYLPCYDKNGAEYVVTVAADRFINMPAWVDVAGLRYFKLRSGTNAAPVNQTAERIIVTLLSHT